MALCTISGRATIAGTNLLPLVSLYAVATVRPAIVQIGLTNTTATAAVYSVNRLTTTGTQGAGLTEVCQDTPEYTPAATGFAGHTVGPTVTGEICRATLGAAVGSGIIWTWGDDKPLEIAAATTNGIGIIVPCGTGQVVDYFIWWMEP
jgi:hypothetical protein